MEANYFLANVKILVFPNLMQFVKLISRNLGAHGPSVNNFMPMSLILNFVKKIESLGIKNPDEQVI